MSLGGLLDQIDRFTQQASTVGAGAEDLYIVWAGGNDFLSQPSNPALAIQTAVTNITNSVLALAQTGATNIIVAKTPNLGRTPLSLEANLLGPLTSLSVAFNTALETSLNALEANLSGVNIIPTDLFSIGEVIAGNASTFGFTNVTGPYLNGLTPADPNADPNTFFFWDRVHPTTKSHSIYANVFRQTILTNVTTPVNRIGTFGGDRLVGYAGADTLSGLGGNDDLEGNLGVDTLFGNGGDDHIDGGGGDDLLSGGIGNDRLLGRGGNDHLRGDGGDDWLEGGLGDDLLNGGLGANRLLGKAGADTFVLNPVGLAIIGDFQNGLDVMQLPRFVSFDNLRITQVGSATQIRVNLTNTLLAALEGVQVSTIGRADFVSA